MKIIRYDNIQILEWDIDTVLGVRIIKMRFSVVIAREDELDNKYGLMFESDESDDFTLVHALEPWMTEEMLKSLQEALELSNAKGRCIEQVLIHSKASPIELLCDDMVVWENVGFRFDFDNPKFYVRFVMGDHAMITPILLGDVTFLSGTTSITKPIRLIGHLKYPDQFNISLSDDWELECEYTNGYSFEKEYESYVVRTGFEKFQKEKMARLKNTPRGILEAFIGDDLPNKIIRNESIKKEDWEKAATQILNARIPENMRYIGDPRKQD